MRCLLEGGVLRVLIVDNARLVYYRKERRRELFLYYCYELEKSHERHSATCL
jgi:hypothetical protein